MKRTFDTLEERLDYIEFRETLLYAKSPVDRVLFENELTEPEYKAIMDVMEDCRQKLANGENISNTSFEQAVYAVIPDDRHDYHMCEALAEAFAEEQRWEEVFPALYGDMAKYGADKTSLFALIEIPCDYL